MQQVAVKEGFEQLREAAIAFLREALCLLARNPEACPFRRYLVSIKRSQTGTHPEYAERPDWYHALSKLHENIECLPEFKRLSKCISEVSQGSTECDEIHRLLENYLEGLKKPVLYTRKAESVVDNFCNYINSPDVKVKLLAPLACYHSAVRRLMLPSGTKVRAITDEEFSILAVRAFHMNPGIHKLMLSTHLLEYQVNIPKGPNCITSSIREMLLYDASVLRVFGPGRPVLAFVAVFPQWRGVLSPDELFGWSSPRYGRGQGSLEKRSVPALLKFAEQANQLKWRDSKCNPLRTAWMHFSKAVVCDFHEDILLQLVMALEALYLEDEAELRLKLALRVARHISRDDSDRRDVYDIVYNAYKLRNEIVHGSKPYGLWTFWPSDDITSFPQGTPPVVTATTTDLLFEVVSRSLQKWVAEFSQGSSKTQVLKSLDRLII